MDPPSGLQYWLGVIFAGQSSCSKLTVSCPTRAANKAANTRGAQGRQRGPSGACVKRWCMCITPLHTGAAWPKARDRRACTRVCVFWSGQKNEKLTHRRVHTREQTREQTRESAHKTRGRRRRGQGQAVGRILVCARDVLMKSSFGLQRFSSKISIRDGQTKIQT